MADPAATLAARLRAAIWLPSTGGEPPRLRPGSVYPMLLGVVVVLGLNWPIMSVGLRSIPPMWMASFRLIGAAATVCALAAATGRLARPDRSDYPMILSVAFGRLALVFMLIFYALEIVPPGRSSILVWTSSLWTVPLAVAFIGERMTPLRWVGLITGIAGILLVFDPGRFDWTDGRVLLGHGMLLTAAIAGAAVSVHVRSHSWTATPLGLLPWQMIVALMPVVIITLIFEGLPHIAWTPALVAIVVWEGAVASGFAIWAQLTVLRSHPAISTNLALMSVPVIGLLSSALFVDEPLTGAVVAGLGLVLVGVAVSRAADAAQPGPAGSSR